MKKAVKSAMLHTLLLTYTLFPEISCQQIAATGASAFPNTYFQGNVNGHGAKGYNNFQTYPSVYTNSPVHGQYWTGYAQQYPQYAPQQQYLQPQYGMYGGYTGYVQNGAYAPQQYYSQPYGQYGQVHYGQYPGFNAQYWSGQYYQHPVPVYHQQVPVYHHGVPAYHSVYPNHYYPGGRPWYKKRPGRGFLGGDKHGLAKTLLGAAVVGVVAGKVARG